MVVVRPPSLVGADARLARAREHLGELQVLTDSYTEANPGLLQVDGMTVRDVTPMVMPPIAISVIIGETTYNLRAALDYLVFELAALDSGEYQEQTQFLIDDTPESFLRRRSRYLRGVSEPHIRSIEALQPYNGGEWLRVLREISNADKHQAVHVAGWGGQMEIPVGRGDEAAEEAGGFEIEGELGYSYTAALTVTFADGTPVMDTISALVERTCGVLDAFRPDLEADAEVTS